MDKLADFTASPVAFLHVDINSCFATIEQQANPHLRGLPTAVVARFGPSGCILAASYEAKALGIKTGTRLKEALALCPKLNCLLPDPDKYRHVHKLLKQLLLSYTHLVSAWSIDEFNLDLTLNQQLDQDLHYIALDIKDRIKKEIGDYITVSIGLAPSSYLAKIAAGIQKPNGLIVINKDNYLSLYSSLKVTDLCGINHRLASHLYPIGITTVLDLYHAPLDLLKSALGSAAAQYWRLRLRGIQVSFTEQAPKSFGHSFVLPKPLPLPQTIPILSQLLQKATRRMRQKNFQAKGLSLYLGYKDALPFHQYLTVKEPFFDDKTALHLLKTLLRSAPKHSFVKHTAVNCFALSSFSQLQLSLFTDRLKDSHLTSAIDKINSTWGELTIASTPALLADTHVPDSIGFGRVRELV